MPKPWPDNAHPSTIEDEGGNDETMVYTVPTGVLVQVESIVATVDTNGGSGSKPRVVFRDNAGVIIAEVRQSSTIPSGTTDRATWAVGLADDLGDFIHWGRNEDDDRQGLRIFPDKFIVSNIFQSEIRLDSNGGPLNLESNLGTIEIGAQGTTTNPTLRLTGGLGTEDARLIGTRVTIGEAADAVGFYNTTPVVQQTGVPVTAAAIHAALVNLGLITA